METEGIAVGGEEGSRISMITPVLAAGTGPACPNKQKNIKQKGRKNVFCFLTARCGRRGLSSNKVLNNYSGYKSNAIRYDERHRVRY